MGLDMNMYAAEKEITDLEQLWEERDLPCWYWRKANAIHKWMVENVQNGQDDCGLYEVQPDHLARLKEDVVKVLGNPKKADKILPTGAGFFFGSTDYDEWYMNDLHDTLKYVTEMLTLSESNPQTKFYYYSSW